MSPGKILRVWLLVWPIWLAACTANNVVLGPDQTLYQNGQDENRIVLEAARDGVFAGQGEQRRAVRVLEQAPLAPDQAAAVDHDGRALVRVGEQLTMELLKGSEVRVEEYLPEAETVEMEIRQNGGIVIFDLAEDANRQQRLTVQTTYALVQATGTRFAVITEAENGLEWIVALEAKAGDLQVTAGDATETLTTGEARWVTPVGAPGPVIASGKNGEAWLGQARNSDPEVMLSELLLAPANILADTGGITYLVPPGTPFEFGRDTQGAVTVTFDPQGIFGSPSYTLEDCNGDGVQDVAVVNGVIDLDFNAVQARVQALDVGVFNRTAAGNGSLQVFDAVDDEIGRVLLDAGPGEIKTLSLRHQRFFYRARLALGDACFLGLSLTPPGETRDVVDQIQVRPITENLQSDAVVNILATSADRSSENGSFQAPFVGPDSSIGPIIIDGETDDWDELAQWGLGWTTLDTITHDEGCSTRFPNAGNLTDLSARMQLAFDKEFLYAAFIVNDDGLVTYTGADERLFLGDSPQLLLDLDLNSDFDEAKLSADDVQIDFLPNTGGPRAAFWQLSSLASRPLVNAAVAVTPTDSGYFLEAAIPWQSLGFGRSQGDKIGVVVSVSDNDTPGSNAQQCIISTSPNRDWQNPTTWGTVLLMPVR
ncbi:MAG: hypothetical protein H6632_10920 [Anaerolineales bacterium]|nr:hypothetical protein [Anaerolineales bacterium]